MLQNRAIVQVKVQWKQFEPEEATWELEDAINKAYLLLFQSINKLATGRTLGMMLLLRGT